MNPSSIRWFVLSATILVASTFLVQPVSAQGAWPAVERQSKLSRSVWDKIGASDIAGALKLLDKQISANKDLFEAYDLRATVRSQFARDIDGALDDLRLALVVKPGDSDTYARRARLKIRYKNDYEGALREYDEILKVSPDSVRFLYSRSLANIELRRFDAALADINRCIALQPEQVDYPVTKSMILSARSSVSAGSGYLRTFLKNYTEQLDGKLPKIRGERVLKRGLKKFGDGPASVPVNRHSQMEFSPRSYAEYQKQQSDVETARSISKAYLLLGRNYIKLNLLDDALTSLTQALDFDPNAEEAMGLRGVIYLSRNEPLKAIKEFDEALDIADEPHFYLNRGVAYLLVNEDKKAQRDFDFLMKNWPDSRSVMETRIEEAKKKRALQTIN